VLPVWVDQRGFYITITCAWRLAPNGACVFLGDTHDPLAQRFALIAVLLFACGSPAYAQGPSATIVGTVVDARTLQPLAGVLVELVTPHMVTTTSEDGTFRLEGIPPGKGELLISFVGYAFTKRDVEIVAGDNSITIPLAEGTTAYDESVIVRGDVFGARESGVAAQQSLGSAELRQLGGMTLDDPLRAVQALAGVTASDDLYSELIVRGQGFEQLNYRLDGVPAGFLMHTIKLIEDGGSVSAINSDVLDHVSLLRGAYPQTYGGRLGAELDFAAREGSRQRVRYNVTASGTSASLTSEGPLGGGRGSWLVSGRRSYLDLFLKQVLHSSSVAFAFSDLFSKAVYDFSDHHQLKATVVVGRSRLDRAARELGDPDGLGVAMHAGWMGAATWRHIVSPRLTLTHQVFATGESYHNDTGQQTPAADGLARTTGYRLDSAMAPSAGVLVEAGVSIERNRADQAHVFVVPGWRILGGENFNRSTHTAGAYGQLHWTKGAFTVTPGARVDRFALTGDLVSSPWLQLEWQGAAGLRLVGGAALAYQFPSIAQVVGRRGNPNLRPERNLLADAGVEGRLGSATRWQVSAYNRQERDLIDLPGQYFRIVNGVVRPPSSTAPYLNALDGHSRGIEFMLQRKSPDALSGWLAYSLGRTRYTNRATGERFDGDFDQRHTVTAFARYVVSERTSVNARWRFGSNRPVRGYFEERAGGFFVGFARNGLRVPIYSRLDARFDRTYQWGRRRLTLFGEVINVLNRENVRPVLPGINTSTGQAFGPLDPMFPIVPSVGVTLEF
jgi:hypothetical protein